MKIKRYIFLLIIVLLLLATGCTSEQQTDSPSGETVTITFAYPGEETEMVMRPQIIQMFMEKYPNIIVEEQAVPGDYDTTVLAQIAAGDPPDVFVSGDIFVAPYINNGVAEDLTPFFDVDPEISEDDFYPNVIDYFRDEAGHVFMMPDAIDVQRIYYNKNVFDQAGVPYPDEDWTLEEFETAAASLVSGEGQEKIYGFFADSWFAVWLPYIWMNGGNLISEDGTECVLNQPEAVEALDWYGSLIQQGYSPSPMELKGLGMGGWDMFVTGRVAMLQTGGWDIPSFSEEAEFEWSMAPLPSGKEKATFLHLTNYLMASNSDNKDAAWTFLKFLASPEVYTLEAAEYGWGVPPRPNVADAFMADPPENATIMNTLNVKIGQSSTAFGELPAKILNFDEFMGDGVEVGLEAFWNGEISAQEAADLSCSVPIEPFE